MKYLFVALLFLPSIIFAQNELLGTWDMEMFGVPGHTTWFIQANGIISVTSPSRTETIQYKIDQEQEILTCTFTIKETIDFRYIFEDTTLSLYMKNLEQSPLYTNFGRGFANMEGINSVTDEGIEKLKVTMAKAFDEIVMIRGRRIAQVR